MPHHRLGEVSDRLDAERFVGRESEVSTYLAARADGGGRVLYLHGPGGVGKSALLRELVRRTGADEVVRLDGRVVGADLDAVAAAVAVVPPGGVLVVDEVDALLVARARLRDLLRALPADAVAVLAGRTAPDRDWFDDGFDQVLTDLPVRPLPAAVAGDLLDRHGVTDASAVDDIRGWAAGYPLALTMAATTGSTDTGRAVGPGGAPVPDGASVEERIVARLAGHELDGVDADVLDVAGISPLVDGRLLASVLPGRSTRQALGQLRASSLTEPVGNRVTLHPLVRRAVRRRLRDTDPEGYRSLVVAVADHLRSRAEAGDRQAQYELLDLIEDPATLVGLGASASHHLDRPRPGDVESAADRLGAEGTAWWTRLERWARERPGDVSVVRSADGTLAAVAVLYGTARLPAWAADQPEVGPVLAVIEERGHAEQALLAHDMLVVDDGGDPAIRAEVVRVGNSAARYVAGVRNPRYTYVTMAADAVDHRGTSAFGCVEVPELRRHDGERELVTVCTDMGPGGLIGYAHALVLAEQQREVVSAAPLGEALLSALRHFRDDRLLAGNPLGADPAAVRASVRVAMDAAFGPSPTDQQLRQALEQAYLDPGGSHGLARAELHMSRATFYRHLQRARERLVSAAVG